MRGTFKGMVSIKRLVRRYKACGIIIVLLAVVAVLRYGSFSNLAVRPVLSWTDTVTDTDGQDTNQAWNKPDKTQLTSKKINERRATVLQRCKELNGYEPPQPDMSLNYRYLIVNDKYKLLYCFIPKVACTSLKRMFLILTGQMNTSDPNKLSHGAVHTKLQFTYLPFLTKFNDTEKLYRLTHYKKIIFVRDPFERVLSAYRDKFRGGQLYYLQKFGRYIVKQFRTNPSKTSLEKGNDVTFSEFVKFLIRRHKTGKGFEKHWEKYTSLCHPCHVKYDYVGRFDSLQQDVHDFLEEIGYRDDMQFPGREASTNDVMREFYSQLEKTDMKRLIEIYANDSFLFDYKTPSIIDSLLNSSLNVH